MEDTECDVLKWQRGAGRPSVEDTECVGGILNVRDWFKFLHDQCENHWKTPERTSKDLCRIMLASPDTHIDTKTFPTGNSIEPDARKWQRGLVKLFFNEEGEGRGGFIAYVDRYYTFSPNQLCPY